MKYSKMVVSPMSIQSAMDSESGFKSLSHCDKLERLRLNRQDVGSSTKNYKCHRALVCNFFICIALLFGVFIHPASGSADCTITVLDLPFSVEISNPCALVDEESLHRDALSEEAREIARKTAVDEMKSRASLLKDEAETILRTDAIEGCSSLQLPLVAAIPTADDIADKTPLEVLRLFYTSLLKHTAHISFMADQLESHSESGACTSSDLFNSTESLASAMRNLVCSVRFSTVAIQDEDEKNSFVELTDQVLSEKLSDQSLCSRRNIRDCQTVRSTITVLQELLNYLQTMVVEATTVLGEL